MSNHSDDHTQQITAQDRQRLSPPPKPAALQKPPRPAFLLGEKILGQPDTTHQASEVHIGKQITPPLSVSPKSVPTTSSNSTAYSPINPSESPATDSLDTTTNCTIKKPAVPTANKPAIPKADKPAIPTADKPAVPTADKPAIPTSSKPAVIKTTQQKDVKPKAPKKIESVHGHHTMEPQEAKPNDKKTSDGKPHHSKSNKHEEPSLNKNAAIIPEPPNYSEMDCTEKLEFLDSKLQKLQDLKLQHQKFIERIERHLKRTEEEKLRVSEQVEKEKKSRFGLRLQDALERDKSDVPLILKECVDYIKANNLIEQEGIFRISSSQEKLKSVMDYLDSSRGATLSRCPSLSTDPHLVPCLLKKYLRMMPEPIVPFDCYTTFIACYPLDTVCRLKKFKDIISLFIPKQNWIVLKYILEFLRDVSSCSAQNRMTVSNLGTVFGPLLLRDSEDYDPLNECSMVSGITAILIENLSVLFTTPPE